MCIMGSLGRHVGRQSTDISVDYRSTIGLYIGRLSIDCRPIYRSTVGRSIGRLSTDSRSIVDRRPIYRPMNRPICRPRPPIVHMIQFSSLTWRTPVFFLFCFFLWRFISQAVDNRPTIIENKHFLSFLIKNSGQESPLTHFTPISPKSDLFLHVVKTSIVFLQHLILEGERVRRLLDEDFNLFQNGLSSKSALIYLWSSGKRRRKKKS